MLYKKGDKVLVSSTRGYAENQIGIIDRSDEFGKGNGLTTYWHVILSPNTSIGFGEEFINLISRKQARKAG